MPYQMQLWRCGQISFCETLLDCVWICTQCDKDCRVFRHQAWVSYIARFDGADNGQQVAAKRAMTAKSSWSKRWCCRRLTTEETNSSALLPMCTLHEKLNS